MNEVSCKAPEILLEVLAQRGIPGERLVEGLPLALRDLANPRKRIDWDLHVALLERAEKLCGGSEGVEEVGTHIVEATQLRAVRALAALFVSLRQLYWMGCRWVCPAYFSHIAFDYEELAGGRVRVTVEIPPPYRDSELFFRMVRGSFRVVPGFLGQKREARVEMQIEPRRAVYTITPPRSFALGAILRRVFKRPGDARKVVEALSAQQEDLNVQYAELRTAKQRLGTQAQQLETIDILGRELLKQIESEGLSNRDS